VLKCELVAMGISIKLSSQEEAVTVWCSGSDVASIFISQSMWMSQSLWNTTKNWFECCHL